jgi:hypothetical protein
VADAPPSAARSAPSAATTSWRIRRRWLPWRRRIRDVPDAPFLNNSVDLDGPIGAVILVVCLILALPALLGLALLLFELLALLLLLPLALLARMLLPVPWTIELWSRPESRRLLGWRLEGELRVAGWGESARAIGELKRRAAQLRPGESLVPVAADPGQAPQRQAGDQLATPNPFAQRDER